MKYKLSLNWFDIIVHTYMDVVCARIRGAHACAARTIFYAYM